MGRSDVRKTKAKDVKTAKCHHGYSKKSCKECVGEKKIIKALGVVLPAHYRPKDKEVLQSVDKAQAGVIVAALEWYEASKDWLDPNNANSGRNLRIAIEKLIAAQRKKKT